MEIYRQEKIIQKATVCVLFYTIEIFIPRGATRDHHR